MNLTPNKRVSYHASLKGGVVQTLKENTLPYTLQFYGSNPKTYASLKDFDKDWVRKHCDLHLKTFYIHANYPVLAGYPTGEKKSKCVKSVNDNLEALRDTQGTLLMHIGKGKDSDIENVIDFVNEVEAVSSEWNEVPLVLENAAGQGYEIGSTIEELEYIMNHSPPEVGLCIDTQHAFGAGMLDFRRKEEVDKMFDLFGDRLKVIHLNDSAVTFGSKRDAHGKTPLGEGCIWGRDKTALKYLLKHCYERELDAILETGGGKYDWYMTLDEMYDL